jgi:transposase InsO family protein
MEDIVSDRSRCTPSESRDTYSWSSFCLGNAAIVRVVRGYLVCRLIEDDRPVSRLVCVATRRLSTLNLTCLRQRGGYRDRIEGERLNAREDVADTSPEGALLFFPSYSATGANTCKCTVAGDQILDSWSRYVARASATDALINTSLVTHIPGIARSVHYAAIGNGRVLDRVWRIVKVLTYRHACERSYHVMRLEVNAIGFRLRLRFRAGASASIDC